MTGIYRFEKDCSGADLKAKIAGVKNVISNIIAGAVVIGTDTILNNRWVASKNIRKNNVGNDSMLTRSGVYQPVQFLLLVGRTIVTAEKYRQKAGHRITFSTLAYRFSTN